MHRNVQINEQQQQQWETNKMHEQMSFKCNFAIIEAAALVSEREREV